MAKMQRNIRMEPADYEALSRALKAWNARHPKMAIGEADFLRNAIRVAIAELEDAVKAEPTAPQAH